MQLAISLLVVLCNVNYCNQTDDVPVFFFFFFINYVDCILFVILFMLFYFRFDIIMKKKNWL